MTIYPTKPLYVYGSVSAAEALPPGCELVVGQSNQPTASTIDHRIIALHNLFTEYNKKKRKCV